MNKSIVAFIDVIGFKELLDDYFTNKSPDAWNQLGEIFKYAEETALGESIVPKQVKLSAKFFSDCVSISMPIDDSDEDDLFLLKVWFFIRTINLFQTTLFDGPFLKNNTEEMMLSKGGISIGGHEENGHLIFSEALVSSYKIEQSISIYPRIVIDEKLITEFENRKNKVKDKSILAAFDRLLVRNWDDTVFLNYMELPSILYENLAATGKLTAEFALEQGWITRQNQELTDDYKAELIKNMTSDDLLQKLKDQEHGRKSSHIKSKLSALSNIKDNAKWLKWKWLMEYNTWCYNKEESKIRFSYYSLNDPE